MYRFWLARAMYRFREPLETPLFTGVSENRGSRFVRK